MRKFLSGLIVGMLIVVPITVFAQNDVETITAYLNPNIKITLDGEPIALDKTPIVYDQTTYLPLREIGEKIMGVKVGWNQEKGTVELSSADQSKPSGGEEVKKPNPKKNRPDYAALFIRNDNLGVADIEAKIRQINIEMRQFREALEYESKYPGAFTPEIIEVFEQEIIDLEEILPYWTDLLEQKKEELKEDRPTE